MASIPKNNNGLSSLSEASSGIHHFAYASVRLDQDFDSLFNTVKESYLEWRKKRGEGRHSFSVYASVSKKDDNFKGLVAQFIQRWNDDLELTNLPSIKVEFCIKCRGNLWIGCDTSVAPADFNFSSQMRFVDANAELAQIEAKLKKLSSEQSAMRQATPIQNPVCLPKNIATEIARYLRLEYGESYASSGSIKARDLKMTTEVIIDGVPTQFWSYPTSPHTGPRWATVERLENSYVIGTTSKAPPTKGTT